MSLDFDFIFACDLRAESPEAALDALRYLASQRAEPPPACAGIDAEVLGAFLADDGRPLTALLVSMAALCGQSIARLGWPPGPSACDATCDDTFYETWWVFALWLGPLSTTEGLVGYFREQYTLHPDLLYFRGGHAYLHKVSGTPVPIGDGVPRFATIASSSEDGRTDC